MKLRFAIGKMINKYCLLISSALLLASSYMFPEWCAEGSILFLIPLLYAAMHYRCSFKEGLLFGFVFNSLYLSGLLFFIIEHGQHFIKYGVTLLVLAYSALLCALWFYMSDNACVMANIKESEPRLFIWGITTWLHFVFISKGFYVIAGVWEGNNLALPLLPLVVRIYAHPWFALAHPHTLFLGVILGVISFALYRYTKRGVYLIIPLLLVLGVLSNKKDDRKTAVTLPKIACGVISKKYESAYQTAEAISQILAQAQQEKYEMICFPESTCGFNIQIYPEFIEQWADEFDGILCLGGHSTKQHNAYYCLHNCRIMQHYEKSHLMPMTEYIPNLIHHIPLLCNLFIKEVCFVESNHSKPIFQVNKSKTQCFICSELFFDTIDAVINKDIDCAIIPVNDSWFSMKYIPKLMQLYARLKSMQLQKPLIYVSYYYSLIVKPNEQNSYLIQLTI